MFTLCDVGRQKSDTPTELVSFRADAALLAEFEEVSREQLRFEPTRTQMMVNAMKFFIDAHKVRKGRPKPAR